ncbi:ribosomal 40S subunit protein S13 [Conglomerata obtusa]
MARIYSKDHGKSSSIKPYAVHAREPWQAITHTEVVSQIFTLAKKGVPPSKIGLLMRDLYGIGSVSSLTGKRITAILRANGLAPTLPEDLDCLVKKSVSMRAHLGSFKNDKHAKHRLILNDSKLYRLARYYKKRGYITTAWKPNFTKTG